MKKLLSCAASVLVTCALAASANAQKPSSLNKTTQILMQAIFAGKRAEARKVLLTYAELRAMSTMKVPQAKFDKMTKRWLDNMSSEIEKMRKQKGSLTLGEAKIKDVTIFPKSKKTPQPVVFAHVTQHILLGKKQSDSGLPLFFRQSRRQVEAVG
jgi:hypothetical protein